MKWLLFAQFVVIAVPALSLAAAAHARVRASLFGALLASTVVKVSVHFASLEQYRGPDRGFEVGLTDLLALALGIGLLLSRGRALRWFPCNAPLLLAFFGAAVVSTLGAPDPLLSSFTLLKLAKGFALYWVVVNHFRLEAPVGALWAGALVVAGVETLVVVYQKYGLHLSRTPGTFDHSNTIPAYSLLLLPLLVVWLLHGEQLSRARRAATLAAALGLCFCIVATLSRVGVLLATASVAATLGWSLLRLSWSPRRWATIGLLATLGLAGAVKSFDSLLSRFLAAPEASSDARDEFNHAADLMAGDHLLGVGLNCFSSVLTAEPKYRDHIYVLRYEREAGVCHHIYRLTAAEMGYGGAALLILMLARFGIRLVPALLGPPTLDRTLITGAAIGIGCLHLIGLFEWVLRITPVFNLFLVMTGVSVGLAERVDFRRRSHGSTRRVRRRGEPRRPVPSAPTPGRPELPEASPPAPSPSAPAPVFLPGALPIDMPSPLGYDP